MNDTRIPVTVVILTHNEAENIASCVASVANFGEIVVLDSGSTDDTLAILRQKYPHVRVLEHPFEDFGQQRNWALDHVTAAHEWILFLDADERCTWLCQEAVRKAVADPAGNIGFFLCYRNMFMGRWIKHCTMYPTWQLRLLRAGFVRYRREGHGQREVMAGPAGYIHEPYDHYGFSKGVKDWIRRHNEYSTNEVELIDRLASERVGIFGLFSRDPVRRRRTSKSLAARAPLRPFIRFLYLYICRFGFLDGRPGFLFCLLRLAHECHVVVKRAEIGASPGAQSRPRSSPTVIANEAQGFNG